MHSGQNPEVIPTKVHKFSLLRNANFRWLVLGRFTNFLGNAIAPIALAFAVLNVTDSITDLGLVVGSRSIASLAVVLVGGVLADRLPRIALLKYTSLLATLSQGVIAASVLLNFASMPLFVILSVFNGAVAAVAAPIAPALTPATVPRSDLRQANAVSRIFINAAMTGGAAAGGALVAFIGPGWGLALDSLSFAVAGVIFSRIKVADQIPSGRGNSPITDLREGWKVFTSKSWIWVVVLHATVWHVAWAGSIQVLGPVVADQTIGRAAWGVLLSAFSGGLVLGGLLALRWHAQRMLGIGVALSIVPAALPIGLALGSHLGVLVALALMSGLALEQFGVAWDTTLQSNVDNRALARVYSYDFLGSLMAVPIGQMTAGPLGGRFGTQNVLLVAGMLIALSALAALTVRAVRQVNTNVNDTAAQASRDKNTNGNRTASSSAVGQ